MPCNDRGPDSEEQDLWTPHYRQFETPAPLSALAAESRNEISAVFFGFGKGMMGIQNYKDFTYSENVRQHFQ